MGGSADLRDIVRFEAQADASWSNACQNVVVETCAAGDTFNALYRAQCMILP